MAGDSGGDSGGEVLGPVPGPEVGKGGAPRLESTEAITPQLSHRIAGTLEGELNRSGVNPEVLMKGFVEGDYDDDYGDKYDDGNEGTGDEERKSQQREPDEAKQTGDKSQEEKQAKPPAAQKETTSREQQLQQLTELIASFQKGEITTEQLLEGYQKIFGLKALNLREDERYRELIDKELSEWEISHPEPYKGRKDEELTEEQKGEIRKWIVAGFDYRQKIPPEIDGRFEELYPDDYRLYERFGLYYETYYVDPERKVKGKRPSLRADPVWRQMERQATAEGNRVAQGVKNNPFSRETNWVAVEIRHALRVFCERYPEKAEIYALFDDRVRATLTKVKEGKQRSEVPAKGGGSGEEVVREVKEEGNGEELLEQSEQPRQPDRDAEASPKTPEQLVEALTEIRKELGALRKEVARLNNFLDGLNEQAEEILASQGRLPENYEKRKKEQPFLALTLLLSLLALLGIKVAQE